MKNQLIIKRNFYHTKYQPLKTKDMEKLSITVSNFLNWYYKSDSDQEQEEQQRELGYNVIEALFKNKRHTITVRDVFKEAELESLPVKYLEEFPDNNYEEVSEVFAGKSYKIKLID